MPVLTIRIVRDCIYLLISYPEKFSTRVRRLPYAVNVNLNLCNLDQKRIFQSGTLRPHGVDKCFSFNQFIPVFHVTMFPPSGLTCYHTSEKQARISPSRETMDWRSGQGALDSVLSGRTVRCQLPNQSLELVASAMILPFY